MSRLKVQLGYGNYLRQSHESMLTTVRGDDNRFDDRARGRHSEISDAIHELLERASPSPRARTIRTANLVRMVRVGLRNRQAID
jgi:hypothetical protein